jgi:hypothetical protein
MSPIAEGNKYVLLQAVTGRVAGCRQIKTTGVGLWSRAMHRHISIHNMSKISKTGKKT